jgi:hypothetical protein
MPNRILCLALTLSIALLFAGCGSEPPVSKTNSATPPPERQCDPVSDTPTEAYKRLYAAVKAKDTERIKGEASQLSRDLAESLAAKQNNPVAKVYENGFTATTFSPTLPEIRDERVSGCWGAVEVKNIKENRWEDLPFVIEEGAWKFAVGELFGGQYKSPGKGRDMREKEAANVALGNSAVPFNAAGNTNAVNANVPKYDGPQVEPLPKKR